MIVVDANILAYLHLEGDKTPLAQQLMAREPEWCAPGLWRSEFNNVLAIYFRRQRIDLSQALALAASAERRLGRHEYRIPTPQVLELVARSSCSAYDCEYVALAVDLGLPLVTEDRRVLEQFPTIARSMERYLSEGQESR